MTETSVLPSRSCGTCTLCCRLPDIDALSKPANAWCSHCLPAKGCAIYKSRPTLCRDFLCLWMTSAALGPQWEPARSKMMIYTQGPQTTVLVDPDHPEIWKQAPFADDLKSLARDAEKAGGYLIVFVGDDVFKIQDDPQTHHSPSSRSGPKPETAVLAE